MLWVETESYIVHQIALGADKQFWSCVRCSLAVSSNRNTQAKFSALESLKFEFQRRFVKATVAQLHSLIYKQRPISREISSCLTNALKQWAGLQLCSQPTQRYCIDCTLASPRFVFSNARHRCRRVPEAVTTIAHAWAHCKHVVRRKQNPQDNHSR